jgi:hypothetical protein
MGERGGAYRILMGKPDGKRPKHGWHDNTKVNIQEMGWGQTGLIWLRIGRDGGPL